MKRLKLGENDQIRGQMIKLGVKWLKLDEKIKIRWKD